MPLGTLVSNLVAGYIVGVAVACFAQMPNLSPEWRLIIITGFCGGLSTFSTFSIEVVTALERGAYSWALGMVTVHVLGSLLMTIAGLATVWWLKSVW
jgi:CrcB protein